jgi:hypothetical protein
MTRYMPLLLSGLVVACGGLTPPHGDASRIYIRDRLGDHFDITHAVQHYGMDRVGFQHGIGKNAFAKLENPSMLEAGDSGYPGRRQTGLDVIGARIDGDARSYAVNHVVRHEIVNDVIGGSHAAVAY